MKKAISFFKEMLDEYGDFLVIQARPQYSSRLGEERIDKFLDKMKDKTDRYVRKMKGESKK